MACRLARIGRTWPAGIHDMESFCSISRAKDMLAEQIHRVLVQTHFKEAKEDTLPTDSVSLLLSSGSVFDSSDADGCMVLLGLTVRVL